jgi:hypothetical protein
MIYSLIAVLLCGVTHAKYYTPRPGTPLELGYALESIQKKPLSEEEKKKFENSLLRLEQALMKLNREEVLFLIKSEIYKTILRERPDIQIPPQAYSPSYLGEIRAQLPKVNGLLPFTNWLVTALVRDLDLLYQDPGLREYSKERLSPSPSPGPAAARAGKKLSMILPYLETLRLKGAQGLEHELTPVLLNLFDRLANNSELLASLAKRPPNSLATTERYFEAIDTAPTPKTVSKDLEVDEILRKTIDKHKSIGLPLPTGEWRPKDDKNSNTAQVQVIATPDPGYRAPEKLPEPVDDWIFEF